MKAFLEWVKRKIKGHFKAACVHEGDIWWARGERRPVVVLRKFSHRLYLVVPTTTKTRASPWYVFFKHGDGSLCACLHHARVMDGHCLDSKLGRLRDRDFKRVKKGFSKLYS